MKYKNELFNETVTILVKAYMNDTLEHADCEACAVGNIIAARCPDIYEKDPGAWFDPMHGQKQLAKLQIASTGYSYEDVMKIEHAFENCEKPEHMKDTIWGNWKDPEWMFNGLMAVVDVLCEIHGMNETEKTEAKSLFVKA
jgi:hypothetical protein